MQKRLQSSQCRALGNASASLLPADISEAAQLVESLLVRGRARALSQNSPNLLLPVVPLAEFGHHAFHLLRLLARQMLRFSPISAAIVQLHTRLMPTSSLLLHG